MSKLFKHLKTIRIHRRYVRRACFKLGLYWQGLTHDLSKYSLTELSICKYYTGKQSPHQVCREVLGYSPSWIHHYHKNKHHYQFWWDENENGKIVPMKIPYKYVVEALCDMLGASKAYNRNDWTVDKLWDYWEVHCKDKHIMHPCSNYLLEKLLWNMKEMGEKDFYKWYNHSKSYLKNCYENDELDY